MDYKKKQKGCRLNRGRSERELACSIVSSEFNETKLFEKSPERCFTRRSSYDILIKDYQANRNV